MIAGVSLWFGGGWAIRKNRWELTQGLLSPTWMAFVCQLPEFSAKRGCDGRSEQTRFV